MHHTGSKWRKCIAIVLSLSIFTALSIPGGTAHPASNAPIKPIVSTEMDPKLTALGLKQLLNPYLKILHGFRIILPDSFSGLSFNEDGTLVCGREPFPISPETPDDQVPNASDVTHTPVLPDDSVYTADLSDSTGSEQALIGEIVGDSSEQQAEEFACGEITNDSSLESSDDVTDRLKNYVFELTSTQYTNVDPYIIFAIIERESRWNTDAYNNSSGASGLMQLVPKWYKGRMKEFGYNDIFDPYANIHLGVDSISSLLEQYGDIELVLMLYSGNWNVAFRNYSNGIVSAYASGVLQRAKELRGGV